jgi:hypothetical protein
MHQDGRVQHHSTLDHCYVVGVRATVQVLPDATTDHHPLLLTADACRISGSNNSNSNTKMVNSRNFKALGTAELGASLEQNWNWGDVHAIRDVNEVHAFVLGGITAALDIVAPLKEIRVKKRH